MNDFERNVLAVRDDATVMSVEGFGNAKAFARQLLKKGKEFHCYQCGETEWEFVVYEDNEHGGMAGVWA